MNQNSRRDFLTRTVGLGAGAFFLAGCKTMDTVTQVLDASVGSQTQVPVSSIVKAGQAVAKTFESFTPEQEYYIGRTIGAMVLDKYPAFNNGTASGPANLYINTLGQALAKMSDRPETFGGYRFLIQDSDEINAFAAPGGFIFVTRGMIRCCKDEDALAAVLAHEIGHVQEKHGLQAIHQSRVTQAVTTLGMEGAKYFGPRELSALTQTFEDSIADITHTLIVSGYSRSQEKEADLAAVTILKRVGYSPQGLPHMLEQMEKQLKPNAKDFAKTHPSPRDRIASLEKTLGPYSPYALPKRRRMRFFKQAAWV